MIHCEYAHTMGNSLDGFADYWRAIRATHGLQGGFIWNWVEREILRPETVDWGYGGDFGDHPNDVNFCCNGMVNPDRTPKPQLWDAKRVMQPPRHGRNRTTSWLGTRWPCRNAGSPRFGTTPHSRMVSQNL